MRPSVSGIPGLTLASVNTWFGAVTSPIKSAKFTVPLMPVTRPRRVVWKPKFWIRTSAVPAILPSLIVKRASPATLPFASVNRPVNRSEIMFGCKAPLRNTSGRNVTLAVPSSFRMSRSSVASASRVPMDLRFNGPVMRSRLSPTVPENSAAIGR